jgi:hypothetical protein
MKLGWFVAVGAMVAMVGCATMNPNFTDEERSILRFDLEGIQLGDAPGKLAVFSQVQRVPIKIDGMDVYEIYNPIPQISNMQASFYENKLRKLEIRYFDGPGVNTLTRAGGWMGIRNYLMESYGPPSRFGSDVPIVASQKGLQVRFAKFNGEWVFSRVQRQLNYIAMADGQGGVGVVVIQDITPRPAAVQPIDRGRATTTAARPSATAPPEVVQTRTGPGF